MFKNEKFMTINDRKGLNSFLEKLAIRKKSIMVDNNTIDNFQFNPSFKTSPLMGLESLDDIKKRDEQREKDGFSKKLKIGKFVKPGSKGNIIIIPSVEEEKLVHGPIDPEMPGSGTGQGEGEEGDSVGQDKSDEGDKDQEDGEDDEGNEGSGAGKGEGGEHEIDQDAYEIGKTLTEYFELPNLKDTGKKVVIPYYTYDLSNKTPRFGQLLDKKSTMKKILATNLALLDKSNPKIEDLNFSNLVISPNDKIYRSIDREKRYESQAVVFFIRDYSASMQGIPTQTVVSQHVMIYSWLMYQYGSRVIPRFILHDTEAKEVPDFNTYYRLKIAGGTRIHTAYELVNQIINDENLKDFNLYIFQGSDGDDWESKERKSTPLIEEAMEKCNRIGITIVKNEFTSKERTTEFEDELEKSNLLENKEKIRLDSFHSNDADDDRIIEGIKYLVSEG